MNLFALSSLFLFLFLFCDICFSPNPNLQKGSLPSAFCLWSDYFVGIHGLMLILGAWKWEVQRCLDGYTVKWPEGHLLDGGDLTTWHVLLHHLNTFDNRLEKAFHISLLIKIKKAFKIHKLCCSVTRMKSDCGWTIFYSCVPCLHLCILFCTLEYFVVIKNTFIFYVRLNCKD